MAHLIRSDAQPTDTGNAGPTCGANAHGNVRTPAFPGDYAESLAVLSVECEPVSAIRGSAGARQREVRAIRERRRLVAI